MTKKLSHYWLSAISNEIKLSNYRDAEILKLKLALSKEKSINSMGFTPSFEQWIDMDKWKENHTKEHHGKGNDGSYPQYSYRFMRSENTNICSVICESCNKSAISDCVGDYGRYEELLKQNETIMYVGEVTVSDSEIVV